MRILAIHILLTVMALGALGTDCGSAIAQTESHGAGAADPVQELRKEVAELRARIAELEKRLPAHTALTNSSGTTDVSGTQNVPKTEGSPESELPSVGPAAFDLKGTDISAFANDRSREAYGFGVGVSKYGWAITYVYKGSQAERAGLRPGDTFRSLNGQSVQNWSPTQMAAYLADNKTVKIGQVYRGPSGPNPGPYLELTLIQEKQSNFLAENGLFEFVNGKMFSLLCATEGREVPSFTIYSSASQPVMSSLRALKDSWVLVYFAEGWDQQQLQQGSPERDSIFQTAKALKDKGLKYVFVCLDSSLVKEKSILWRQMAMDGLAASTWFAHDGKSWDNEAVLEWGVSITPTICLVAPGNILRRAHIPHDRLLEVVTEEMAKPNAEPEKPVPSPLHKPRAK